MTGLSRSLDRVKDRYDVIVVGLAVYAALGLTTDAIVRYIERKALAWRA